MNIAGEDGGTLVDLPAQHGEELPIALPSAVEQKQLCEVCELHWVYVELTRDLALFVAEAEEEMGAQFAIELERPSEAVGDVQRCWSDMSEGRGSAYDGRAIRRVVGDVLRREPVEDRDIDGDLVVEDAEAAANGGAIVASWSHDETDARSNIDEFAREAVVIDAYAEIDRQAGANLPAVLYEECELVLCRLR